MSSFVSKAPPMSHTSTISNQPPSPPSLRRVPSYAARRSKKARQAAPRKKAESVDPCPPLVAATTPPTPRRQRLRGLQSALQELAHLIVDPDKSVVIITGAGLSVASGVRPFRSQPAQKPSSTNRGSEQWIAASKVGLQEGLWNDVIWSTATRASFRKDPVAWYNDFWLPNFADSSVDGIAQPSQRPRKHRPNQGHKALNELLSKFPGVKQLTQNIDGLQSAPQSAPTSEEDDDDNNSHRLIEIHGRVGLYKCLPDSDSDTDSDSDDNDSREVHLGHRRKTRLGRQRFENPATCPYQYLLSLSVDQLESDGARSLLQKYHRESNCLDSTEETLAALRVKEAPSCPVCGNSVLPQALLFDEGYHSHSFYQFEKAEDWLSEADALVFVGTSFAVRLTTVALQHARQASLPVFNINPHDALESTSVLNATNLTGSANELLPQLLEKCNELLLTKRQARGNA